MEVWAGLYLLLACVNGILLPPQKSSLLDFHNSTSGDFWIIRWNTSADPCGPPSWYGITCDGAGANVLQISLRNNNLTGPLPNLALPELTSLYVQPSQVPYSVDLPIGTSSTTHSQEHSQIGPFSPNLVSCECTSQADRQAQ